MHSQNYETQERFSKITFTNLTRCPQKVHQRPQCFVGPFHPIFSFSNDRYVDVLGVLATFDQHFSNKEITNHARRMTIWRQPLADLESPQILQYKLNYWEVWKTWSRTESLHKFSQVSNNSIKRTEPETLSCKTYHGCSQEINVDVVNRRIFGFLLYSVRRVVHRFLSSNLGLQFITGFF